MSYILDALRKSEHERQMATGKITGMLYPVQIDQRKSAVPWIVLVSVITLLLLLAAVWKFWPQAEVKAPDAAEPRISAESFPKLQLQQPHLMTEPEEDVTVLETPARKRERAAVKAEVAAAPAVSRPTEAKRSAARIVAVDKPPAAPPETSESTASAEPAAPVDPLAGMPELIIYGYVHNETGGSFAMINDRLLQEGDEIAPGLKLVKILETKGVFNYRGHEFTR